MIKFSYHNYIPVFNLISTSRGPVVPVHDFFKFEVVLDAEVLGLLSVDEGSGEGVLLGDDGVVVLKTVVSQHLLDLSLIHI